MISRGRPDILDEYISRPGCLVMARGACMGVPVMGIYRHRAAYMYVWRFHVDFHVIDVGKGRIPIASCQLDGNSYDV